MFVVHLFSAVGADEQDGQIANTPPDDAQQVERRLICPVQILEHDQARQTATLS